MASKPKSQPAIPESYLDVPSQRLYYLSLGLLCQAIKIFDFFQYLFTSDDTPTHYGKKWLLVDFAYCTILSQLRIPRLQYSKSVVIVQILTLWFLDGVLFGGISLNLMSGGAAGSTSPGFFSRLTDQQRVASTPEPFRLTDVLPFWSSSPSGKNAHLVGQHTVRMSPISTAYINPDTLNFCLSPPHNSVLIPILLNNTNIAGLRYTLTPLGSVEGQSGKTETIELSSKELKAIEQARASLLQVARIPRASEEDEDEDGDDADPSDSPASELQKTQSLTHIRLTKPGTLRLDSVLDASGVTARIFRPATLTIVPCPSLRFASSSPVPEVHCTTRNQDHDLQISLHGVPPLSMRWYKEINGRREHFLVEGIEGPHAHTRSPDATPEFAQVEVPLTASLSIVGTHSYVLEEVTDSAGNTVRASPYDTFSLRSLTVLRRPNVSFKACRPGSPASLLIGGATELAVHNEGDEKDGPWEVKVGYEPEKDEEGRKKGNEWTKELGTEGGEQKLVVHAAAPGEYTILGIKGKYCEGDVQAPSTCPVYERPLPTASITWERIHACSGDTGLSASLLLHGTPPFTVTYLTQRDKEPARTASKTFSSARGTLTLTPEREGHYVYSFTHVGDAHYKQVALDGPSVEQAVHPLASAEFRGGARGEGRKRVVNSCSGNKVAVEVDLKGAGPWNLELQVVGPKSSETIVMRDLTAATESLQIPIPTVVDKNGGSFDIDLVSIEDSSGCKRPLSVPGISVNVRRVQPTAQFYGKPDHRSTTVLEKDSVSLPLRLTGDGPWSVKYRRQDAPNDVKVARLTSPNDHLQVRENGIFEILEVADSQCPGSVIANQATYKVDWVPRPHAKLSPQTKSTYESYNGSHILSPVCINVNDHVDLDLSGRPPFQLLYNIAQGNGVGGTTLLGQPTFSSIQPRSRFQLHTSAIGRKYYEVKQIGDAAYPLAKHKNAVVPRAERLLFEQEVMARPAAAFKNKNRLSHCLYDSLVSRDVFSADGVVILDGTPPFQLKLSIRNLAAGEVRYETVRVSERLWKMDVPTYSFTSIGAYRVSIEEVQDASMCEQATLDPATRSVWIDVAETAAIVPFDRRENYCVGDVSQFQLEGTPPWTVGYRINGKSYTQESKVSPFSLQQQQAGEFTITSIAHQQKMCKAVVTDLRFAVHAVPSAKVGHGKRIYQDIHEGDQAEIVFTLIGEPPFTFTYQRAEASPKRGGKPGKVLETHTVTGVTTTEYSIYSASEGTWTVTSISDRYCRYPSSRPDAAQRSRQ